MALWPGTILPQVALVEATHSITRGARCHIHQGPFHLLWVEAVIAMMLVEAP